LAYFGCRSPRWLEPALNPGTRPIAAFRETLQVPLRGPAGNLNCRRSAALEALLRKRLPHPCKLLAGRTRKSGVGSPWPARFPESGNRPRALATVAASTREAHLPAGLSQRDSSRHREASVNGALGEVPSLRWSGGGRPGAGPSATWMSPSSVHGCIHSVSWTGPAATAPAPLAAIGAITNRSQR
jgi:hypothetical protein